MTTDDAAAASSLDRLNANLSKVDELSRRLASVLAQKKQIPTALQGPGQDLFAKAAAAYMAEMIQNPSKIIEQQVSYWGKTLKQYVDAQELLAKANQTATETEHKTPLIIFPPWINKFYILDLKPQNSLIKWIVDQGYTLFVVSWINPDTSYAEIGMDDYVQDGYLAAFDAV
jgi:poly(3-hydroxyalkanoate) synthetase